MHFYNPIKIGSINTSEKEIKDILKAWLIISLAFSIALSGSIFSSQFYFLFIVSSLTVGVGFLLHELGHKIMAQRYGCFAEFRSFDNMLFLAVIMSFFGFIFAAPGAVMISGKINTRKNGIISAAGPIVNLALAMIFLALILSFSNPTMKIIASYGFEINTWLALFNMIPFWLFDGYKILKWNKFVYGSIIAVGVSFMFLQNYLR